MSAFAVWLLVTLTLLPMPLFGQDHGHHHMHIDESGMVMNANATRLPRGCETVSRDYEFTVRASQAYATDAPGSVFGMSEHRWQVEPCSRVTVTFINEDEVRHQWMVHGLPSYLYPQAMFHLEASAGATQRGTFIVPADDKTYLVHCDMAQHMEKGMKGQLVVGAGSGDLWSVKSVGRAFERSDYLPVYVNWLVVLGVVAGVLLGVLVLRVVRSG